MFNSYIIYKRAIYTIAMLNYVEFPRRVDIPLPALNGASPLRFSPALLRTFGIPQRPDLDILHLETLDLGKVDFNWAIWAFKIHPDSVFSSLDPALDPQNQKNKKKTGPMAQIEWAAVPEFWHEVWPCVPIVADHAAGTTLKKWRVVMCWKWFWHDSRSIIRSLFDPFSSCSWSLSQKITTKNP